MEYECKLVAFDHLVINPLGVQESLCNNCQAPDCSNPIEERVVSVFGVSKKMRLWVISNVIKQVVACKGYIGSDNVVGKNIMDREDQDKQIKLACRNQTIKVLSWLCNSGYFDQLNNQDSWPTTLPSLVSDWNASCLDPEEKVEI